MASSILISLVMIIVTFFAVTEASRELIHIDPPPTGTVVRIINQLGGNTPLTVHCKSKNDDLGLHTLSPGSSWEFKFNPLFITVRTLFFCRMEWPGSWNYFDIYKEARDEYRCYHECFWNIVASGPCDSKSGQCYPWNPKG